MKKIAVLVAATAMFAAIGATALAAPVIPRGATPPHGDRGTCTNCHTYSTPAPAPAPKPVVAVPVKFVRIWGSNRAVNAFANRAPAYIKVVFAGRATRRAVFAVKSASADAFIAKAKASFTKNVDTYNQTKTRNCLSVLGYPLPVK